MAGIDAEKIAQEAINAIAEKIKNLNTLNIIVAGKTGVGKSTLINSVFKEKLADTGMGKPVTSHMRKITKKGVPLAIYDTRGFELGKEVQAEVKQEVMDTISKGLATQNINKRTLNGEPNHTSSNYRCAYTIIFKEKSTGNETSVIE